MEELLNEIVERIAHEMPQLSVVAEDYGQLETEEEVYPVSFPCVLVSIPNIEWENYGNYDQRGICSIVTRLACDCDGVEGQESEEMEERQLMAAHLHRTLQGNKFATSGKLSRVRSACNVFPDSIKVYETEYTTSLYDPVGR